MLALNDVFCGVVYLLRLVYLFVSDLLVCDVRLRVVADVVGCIVWVVCSLLFRCLCWLYAVLLAYLGGF